MKQFFLEFIGLLIMGMFVFWLVDLFFPATPVTWKSRFFFSLGCTTVYCIAKALENGYGEDAVDD